jgi:hypothetical protein
MAFLVSLVFLGALVVLLGLRATHAMGNLRTFFFRVSAHEMGT